jgi:hypothetical protein
MTVLYRVMIVGISCSLARSAVAFTIQTPISQGCHERITRDALDRVRARASIPMFDRTFVIADLPFTARDEADGAEIALLLAVRDADLRGHAALDLADLVEVHADADGQHLHCLRQADDDEPAGSEAALDRCRTFIRDEASAAIAGHDTAASLSVSYAFSGRRTEQLPSVYVHAGRALHALQDSFTHALRSPDGRSVRSVLNYVEPAEDRYEEPRDGAPHIGHLDRCDDGDPIVAQRRALATEASARLLEAILAPDLSDTERSDRAGAVLADYLELEAACSPANAWCHAPETAYVAGCACSSLGTASPILLALIGLLLFVRRAARRAVLAAGLMAAFASTSSAQELQTTRTDRGFPGDVSLLVGGGGSLGRTAGVLSAGARVQLSRGFALELSGEWNPWVSASVLRARSGAFNLYLTTTWRYAFYGRINLTSKGSLGTSILLFDTEGAGRGDAGVFAAASPLGIEVRLSDRTKLFVDPAQVAISVPHFTGVPLVEPQFRFTVGLVFDL